jgi:MFS transporter, ACS family, glucarate transporter
MRRRHGVLIGLLLLAAITYLDRVGFSFAQVRIQNDLHLDPRQMGWVMGAFTAAYALFEIPTGTMGDRVGGRRILTRIVVWWSMFTSLTGLARSLSSLMVTRFLFGAGEAGAFPNISSVISRWFPIKERARAMGLSWSASRLGGVFAPLIVIPIQQRFGWRPSFAVLGSAGLVWAVVWFVFYRDHPSEMKGITIKELEEIGDTPHVARSHRLPWTAAFRSRNFILILLMYHTYCWGSYFYISWMPTYLQVGRHFSESSMKWWGSLPFLLSGTANFLGGFFSDKLVPIVGLAWARRSIGAGGLILGGVFMALMATVSNNNLAAVFLALAYGCMDAMLPVSWAVCMDVGGGQAGALSGAMNTAGQVASFSSSVAFGWAVNYLLSHQFPVQAAYSLPIYPMAALLLISGLLFLGINAAEPLVPDERGEPAPAESPLAV